MKKEEEELIFSWLLVKLMAIDVFSQIIFFSEQKVLVLLYLVMSFNFFLWETSIGGEEKYFQNL